MDPALQSPVGVWRPSLAGLASLSPLPRCLSHQASRRQLPTWVWVWCPGDPCVLSSPHCRWGLLGSCPSSTRQSQGTKGKAADLWSQL